MPAELGDGAEDAEQTRESIETSPDRANSVSSVAGGRERSRSASSATLNNDLDVTPTQVKPSKARAESVQAQSALEAVTGLYQKLERLGNEVARLQHENQELSSEARV